MRAAEIRQWAAAERKELVALLRTLAPQEWETASLCGGWRVRDVVAHVSGESIPVPTYSAVFLRSGFSVDRTNEHFVEQSKDMSTDELVDELAKNVDGGAFTALMPNVMLADVLVHQQDIRRPLGKQRVVDPDRLRFTLDHPDPFIRPKQLTKGLRFVATDLSWSKGAGPEVRGLGEAVLMARSGRAAALDELTGDGVAVLRQRMSAA